jgi:hypothetical protein
VFAIVPKFLSAVGENEDGSFDGGFPSCDPVTLRFDGSPWRGVSMFDFLFPKLDEFVDLVNGCVQSREDDVEINGPAAREILPFRIGELGAVEGVSDGNFSSLRISVIEFDVTLSLSKRLWC